MLTIIEVPATIVNIYVVLVTGQRPHSLHFCSDPAFHLPLHKEGCVQKLNIPHNTSVLNVLHGAYLKIQLSVVILIILWNHWGILGIPYPICCVSHVVCASVVELAECCCNTCFTDELGNLVWCFKASTSGQGAKSLECVCSFFLSKQFFLKETKIFSVKLIR